MRYGAKHAMWAPFLGDEPETGMPKYGPAVDLGGINESNDTINFAEASAYADNALKLKIKEFSNGTIAAKMLHLLFSVGSSILGTDADDTEGRSYGENDNAPFGAYGFFCSRMDANKKRYHEVVFYPKVQGSIEGSNYKTKEDQITLEYDSLAFDILCPNCGKYKIEKRFTTEAAAINYLLGLFKGTSEVPGLEGSGIPHGEKAVTMYKTGETAGYDGKKAEDLMGEDFSLSWEGTKATGTGTLKKVTDWEALPTKDDKSGHYFACKLSPAYRDRPFDFYRDGELAGHADKAGDDELFWVLKADEHKHFAFAVDGDTVAEFDLSGATMGE